MSSLKEVGAQNDYLKSLRPLEPTAFPFTDIPLPQSADAFCTISMIRTGTMTNFPLNKLLYGAKDGDITQLPAPAFLIEKVVGGNPVRVLFELGLRNSKDHQKEWYKYLGKIWRVECTPGVAPILVSNDIPLDSISAMILGHAHFDHIGNLATLHPKTQLIVGPGSHSGDELADEMDVPLVVIAQRDVRVLDRLNDTWERIGCLQGIDYFGDGSFWLLDTPGHKPGHLTALVRVSVDPPLYHLLGSDTAHAVQLMHPSLYSPPPRAGLFPLIHFDPSADPDALTSMHEDLKEAYISIAKVGRMDSEPNINVFLAHDPSMEGLFPPGDFHRFAGTREELQKFKLRRRS